MIWRTGHDAALGAIELRLSKWAANVFHLKYDLINKYFTLQNI